MEEPPQGIVRIPPKVLYIDIETSKTEFTVNQFGSALKSGWLDWKFITKPFYVICWSAAWVNDKDPRIFSDAVTSTEAKSRKDKRSLWGIWQLMDKADYVVGHNSKGFDVKMLRTRFIANRMKQPSEFKERDSLKLAKANYRLESQALGYWSKMLGGNPKDHMISDDWDEVDKGNQRAINKMLKYNRGDVREGIHVLKELVADIESRRKWDYRVFP